MSFEILKAPKEYLFPRKKKDYPLGKMKVGEMFEADIKDQTNIYTHVKYMKRDDKSKATWKFTIKRLEGHKIACIRIK